LGRKAGRGFYTYPRGNASIEAAEAENAKVPERVIVKGELGAAEPLVDLIAGVGIPVDRSDGPGLIEADAVVLALCDGRMATQRAAEDGIGGLVTFDLAFDYRMARGVAVSVADQAAPTALEAAVALFQAIGKRVFVVDDVAGLVVMRTVCMLANEAMDAVNQGVCGMDDIDVAMRDGVNYPLGPIAWARKIGYAEVVRVLDNLSMVYGLDRYRASPLLRRASYSGSEPKGKRCLQSA
jgi:3-hydroxybutyryl-CoA dehydrogenase